MLFSVDRVAGLLSRLVEFPSVSGFEAGVCDFLSEYLNGIGVGVERQEVYKTGYNVVVRLGRGGRVMLCGHVDVVPEFDMVDAFKPAVRDGVLYGRGACDMKGGVAAMVLALEELVRRGKEPDVTFAFVVDEEMYGRGAAELMARGIRAEICVITEPTDLKVCVGNASCFEFKLTAYGQSSHGASRENHNAVHLLTKAYSMIEERVKSVFNVAEHKYPMSPIINLGKIAGGYGAWVVPPKAEAEVLIHMHPSVNYETALDKMRRIVEEVSSELGSRVEMTPTHGCDGFIIDKDRDNKYAGLLIQSHREVIGVEPEVGLIEAETDGNALYHKGGIPCIVYGPGEIRYAHSSREQIKLEDVAKVAEVLARFLENIE